MPTPRVAIIGAGPAGLIAAEHLARRGHAVTLYDRMPTPGRKFLLAGRSGLNLTHSEPLEQFRTRYGDADGWLGPALRAFPPAALRVWCEGLGQQTFVGTSGRVFPVAFKAAPLLRAWLQRLDALGVVFAARHHWRGWTGGGELRFTTQAGEITARANATLLALGGASWPRMGSDGAWVPTLRDRGARVADLAPSNCGVKINWSPVFIGRFEGMPLKRIAITCGGISALGEAVVTRTGLEGGAVYALSNPIRSALQQNGHATLTLDLRPDVDRNEIANRVDGARQARSLSNFLRQQAGLAPVAIGLVQEALHAGLAGTPLSSLVKGMKLTVTGLQPLERAISTAGGLAREELDDSLMITRLPGVFAAGEMLDWDAPTGGYLLQACFSTGVLAAEGMAAWISRARDGC